jgi:hypothetical protein
MDIEYRQDRSDGIVQRDEAPFQMLKEMRKRAESPSNLRSAGNRASRTWGAIGGRRATIFLN